MNHDFGFRSDPDRQDRLVSKFQKQGIMMDRLIHEIQFGLSEVIKSRIQSREKQRNTDSLIRIQTAYFRSFFQNTVLME